MIGGLWAPLGRTQKKETEKEERNRERNKAGYTANTSCGRVGRGGNARFHTFRLVYTDRRTDGPMDRRTNWRTDKASYRVACPQLKTNGLTHVDTMRYFRGVTVKHCHIFAILLAEKMIFRSTCSRTSPMSKCEGWWQLKPLGKRQRPTLQFLTMGNDILLPNIEEKNIHVSEN